MKIGDKIRKPMSRADEDGKRRDQDKAGRFVKGQKKERREKEGVVVYIHPKGRYYTLRFDFPNGSYRESFRI